MNITTDELEKVLSIMNEGSGASPDYARGILVGCVSILSSSGLSFDEAIKQCSICAPKIVMVGSVPEIWFNKFGLSRFAVKTWKRTEGRL